MFYRMYLKRRFQKKRSEYVCFFVVLWISMILINLPGVLLDSIDHGAYLQWWDITDGYEVRVLGATEEMVPYFDEVEGVRCVPMDDGLAFAVEDTVDLKYTTNHISYIANHVINVRSGEKLTVHSITVADSANQEMKYLVSGVRLAFTGFAAISLYLAYRLLIRNRKKELKILINFGIERGMLRNVLLLELFIMYVPALILAIAVSNTMILWVLKIFYMPSKYFIWIVYDYSIASFLHMVICSIGALLLSFGFSWRKIISGVFGEAMAKKDYYGRYRFDLLERKELLPERFLTRVNLLRGTKEALPCWIIAILAVLMSTFLFQWAMTTSEDFSDVDITVVINPEITMDTELIDECISKLEDVSVTLSTRGCVTEKVYLEVAQKVKIQSGIKITLADDMDVDIAFMEISGIFENAALYRVTNNAVIREEQQENRQILVWLMVLMAVLIIFCGAVLIYVFSSLIGMEAMEINEKLMRLGAEKQVIYISNIWTAGIRAVSAYSVGIIVNGIICTVLWYGLHINSTVTWAVVLWNVLLCTGVTTLHILPIWKAVDVGFRKEILR